MLLYVNQKLLVSHKAAHAGWRARGGGKGQGGRYQHVKWPQISVGDQPLLASGWPGSATFCTEYDRK